MELVLNEYANYVGWQVVTFRVQRFINCIYSIMTSVLKSEKMSAPEQFMRLKETEYKPLTNLKKREKPI